MGANLQKQKEEKKQKLIHSAYELFLENGISKTSIDQIVKRANVAKGTFYLYFKSKTDIWEAVVVQASSDVLTEAKEELDRHNIPDMADRVLFIADYIIEYFRHNKGILKMIQRNFSWSAVARKIGDDQNNALVGMLNECVCSPCLNCYTIEEAYRTMFLIIEMVGSICYTSIILEQPAPIDQMKPVLFHTIRKILM